MGSDCNLSFWSVNGAVCPYLDRALMDLHHFLVYKSLMQSALHKFSVFLMSEDLIISKTGFLTMNLEFCYQKVHCSDIQLRGRCFVRLLCNRCAFKSILICLLNSLTPKNLYVDTKMMIRARILKKILGIV